MSIMHMIYQRSNMPHDILFSFNRNIEETDCEVQFLLDICTETKICLFWYKQGTNKSGTSRAATNFHIILDAR